MFEDDMFFVELEGKILTDIQGDVGDDEMIFTTSDGKKYRLYHYQDCCEDVSIEDIVGNLNDLIGVPLLMAEEVSFENKNPDGVNVPKYQDSFTWTFYKLATIKGYVTIRWYGASNGYYSESVSFEEIDKGEKNDTNN
jgi:hypothetical protein